MQSFSLLFFFKDTAPCEIYTLSLHDALPIYRAARRARAHPGEGSGAAHPPLAGESAPQAPGVNPALGARSEEHTSELQSRRDLVCRLLLEKKKNKRYKVIAWPHCPGSASIAQ